MSNENKIIIANCFASAGGPIAMSALCASLREIGYDARVLFAPYNRYGEFDKSLRNLIRQIKNFLAVLLYTLNLFPKKYYNRLPQALTVPGCKIKIFPFFNKKNTIVLYPEIVWGNPFMAKKVVRWLLYYHRYYDSENTYSSDDLFVAYRDQFNDDKLNPDKYVVKTAYFNSNLYRQFNFGSRSGKCYILRKGHERSDLPLNFDGPVFDNNMSDKEFVEILNQCEYCYSYDTQTFYTIVASICGCISVIVPEYGKTVADYYKGQEQNHYGRAFGDSPEQIEYAQKTKDRMLERINYSESNKMNARNFIAILEKKFGPIKKI